MLEADKIKNRKASEKGCLCMISGRAGLLTIADVVIPKGAYLTSPWSWWLVHVQWGVVAVDWAERAFRWYGHLL